ncbi:MAG: lytic transglycosylase domain-containing protein [Bacillota bacterium]
MPVPHLAATNACAKLAAGSASFAALFREAEARFELPRGLVEAVARAESGLNPRAVSPAGALGLMQLIPGTARALGVADPFDPVQNVEAGARYLRQLLDRFGGDLRLALAAYNAGPGTVERYRGVPPYAETRAYVEKVLALMSGKETETETMPAVQSGPITIGAPVAPAFAVRSYLTALLLGTILKELAGAENDGQRA